MPKLYKANGEITEVMPKGKKFTLEELQRFVGGLIEYVELPNGDTLIVNEEGLLIGLEYNQGLSNLQSVSQRWFSPIVGDALYFTPAELKKYTR